MKNPYQTGVRIGLWIRFVLIIGIILFLILAAYANGVKQGASQQAAPVVKAHITHNKKVKHHAKKVLTSHIEVSIVNHQPTGLIGPRD